MFINTYRHADAEQDILASAGVLPRHQAKPHCQLASADKASRVAHGRYQCAGDKRPNSGTFRHLAAQVAVPAPRLNLHANFIRLAIEFFKVLRQSLDEQTERPRQRVGAASISSSTGLTMFSIP